jgi:hypothetical protein
LYRIQWQANYHGNWSCHANKPASIWIMQIIKTCIAWPVAMASFTIVCNSRMISADPLWSGRETVCDQSTLMPYSCPRTTWGGISLVEISPCDHAENCTNYIVMYNIIHSCSVSAILDLTFFWIILNYVKYCLCTVQH